MVKKNNINFLCLLLSVPFILTLTGEETNFKSLKTTKIFIIIDAYAHRQGIQTSSLHFLLKRKLIDETQTVGGRVLVDQDHIDCNYSIMRWTGQQLGFSKNKMKKSTRNKTWRGIQNQKILGLVIHIMITSKVEKPSLYSFVEPYFMVVFLGYFLCLLSTIPLVYLYCGALFLEAVLWEHVLSMHSLLLCYKKMIWSEQGALINFWTKIMIELGDTYGTNEKRLAKKKVVQSNCANCKKEVDYEDMTSDKWCGGCPFYSYCGKIVNGKRGIPTKTLEAIILVNADNSKFWNTITDVML